jgi:eukaryotic-like serine/threonine-protein kinase
MAHCFDAAIADAALRGRLSEPLFAAAVKHAAHCATCRQLLFDMARPDVEVDLGVVQGIQERIRGWRAAARAPVLVRGGLEKGDVVDRWVVIRRVGNTEDGCIYEAFDPQLEGRVVLKQLDLRADDPAAAGLVSISQRLMAIEHPNLVKVVSVGERGGYVYLVYALVKGVPLSQIGAEDPRLILGLFAQAGQGLAAAHAAGLAHGCFSATSCVVGRDGVVRVLDFGIAEALAHRIPPPRETADRIWPGVAATTSNQVKSEDSYIGYFPNLRAPELPAEASVDALVLAAAPAALGARAYAAPEQLLGEPPAPAADQFSFCAALFHQLHGRLAFEGESIAAWLRETLRGRVSVHPVRADVPPSVRSALLRGLRRDPEARFAGMPELIAQLGRRRVPPQSRTRMVLAAAIGGTLTVALVLVLVTLAATGRPRASLGAAPVCEAELVQPWDSLWSAGRQDELRAALGGAGAAGGQQAPVLERRLDERVAAWRGASAELCALPAGRGKECSGRAQDVVRDLEQLVLDDPAGRLARAAAAVDAVPAPQVCAGAAGAGPTLWPAAVLKAEVRRQLGLLGDAERLAQQESGEAGGRGPGLLVRGLVALQRGDLLEGARLLEEATFTAQAAGALDVALAAAVPRLALTCGPSDRALWRNFVEAQVRRARDGIDAAPRRDVIDAAVVASLLCEGGGDEAAQLAQRVAKQRGTEASAATAEAQLALAQALLLRGDPSDAQAAAKNAAGIYDLVYGPHHPATLGALLSVAEADLASGSQATAEATMGRVLVEVRDRKGADPVRARALLLGSRLARARGHADEALALAGKSAQEYEAALGGAHPDLAAALLEGADLLVEADRSGEAEAAYRQVTAILATLGHDHSARLARARAGLQLARLGENPPPDAMESIRLGLALSDGEVDPAIEAWLGMRLGERFGARADYASALLSYRRAVTAFERIGDQRGLASAVVHTALLEAEHGNPSDARSFLERALELGQKLALPEHPRIEAALAKILWSAPQERDRARALALSACAELPESTEEGAALRRWLNRRGVHVQVGSGSRAR